MASSAWTILIGSSPGTQVWEVTIHFRTSYSRRLDTPSHRFAFRSRGECNLANSEYVLTSLFTILPIGLSPGHSWQLKRKILCCRRQHLLSSGRPYRFNCLLVVVCHPF